MLFLISIALILLLILFRFFHLPKSLKVMFVVVIILKFIEYLFAIFDSTYCHYNHPHFFSAPQIVVKLWNSYFFVFNRYHQNHHNQQQQQQRQHFFAFIKSRFF